MPYTRFAEIGRVAYVNYGPHAGNLGVIVEILDPARALVAFPKDGNKDRPRQVINFKRLDLTKLMCPLPRGARDATVTKAWAKAEVSKKWEASEWCKKLQKRQARRAMTDLDRFKVMLAKKSRATALRKAMSSGDKKKASK
eukprot:TRINITY_DN6353_c0_g1_i1.p1 TRINITY_DN6353_c0_g1~~TRINITY_DN6353_c0_g1_i1.p1  ORF type:complete len:141 (-),score=22.25 TRINITY_DN6353_c0_g1_i1:295-717(-)